jgi:hypothetical protein
MACFGLGAGLSPFSRCVVPYLSNERCKGRWEPTRLEAYWDWHAGCVVKVGGNLIRDEYVQIGPAIKFNAPSKSN